MVTAAEIEALFEDDEKSLHPSIFSPLEKVAIWIAVAVFTHAKVTCRIKSRANDWLYEYHVSIVRLVDGRYVGVAFKEIGMEPHIFDSDDPFLLF